MDTQLARRNETPEDDLEFLDRTESMESARKGQEDPKDGHLHGFVYGMSYEDYDAVDALNGSKIVLMRRSPMSYKHAVKNPKPPTADLILGTIIHRVVLEPEAPNELAVFVPEDGMLKRAGKKWDAFKERNAGKTILTVPEYERVMRTSSCALTHEPIARYANADGPTEVCMFWRDPITGRRMKARLDKLIPETHTIFDLKTARDATPQGFGAQAYKLGYHIKMAHYSEGYEMLTGIKPICKLGAIEKNEPHESVLFRITDDVLWQGLEDRRNLINQILECEKTNRWPAQYEEETDLFLPAWAMYSEDYNDVETEG